MTSEPPPTESVPSLLAQLQEPDELALIFNPIGLGPPIDAEKAAEHQAATISAAVLCEAVPASVRENFERARKLHLYGVLEYEFFTAAPEYALLVLEAALRFLSYYGDEIPVLRRQVPDILRAEDFDTVRAARKTRLRMPDGTGADLPVYLKGLLVWADLAIEVVVLVWFREVRAAQAASREPADRAHEAVEENLRLQPVSRDSAVGVGRHSYRDPPRLVSAGNAARPLETRSRSSQLMS